LRTAVATPAVATPAVVWATAAATTPASSGVLASIGGLVTGKVAGTAMALGLGLILAVGPVSDHRPGARAPVAEAVSIGEMASAELVAEPSVIAPPRPSEPSNAPVPSIMTATSPQAP